MKKQISAASPGTMKEMCSIMSNRSGPVKAPRLSSVTVDWNVPKSLWKVPENDVALPETDVRDEAW